VQGLHNKKKVSDLEPKYNAIAYIPVINEIRKGNKIISGIQIRKGNKIISGIQIRKGNKIISGIQIRKGNKIISGI
jgi:hypothetical protein